MNILRPDFTKMPTTSTHSDYIVILNDLHLADGYHPNIESFSPCEMFFHDHDFRAFLDYVREQAVIYQKQCTLLLLGDVLDFLHVRDFRSPDYQLDNSQQHIIDKLDLIIDGHKVFFKALADFATEGHQVHIVAGNHDIELILPNIQQQFRKRLRNLAKQSRKLSLCFFPWIYYSPNLLYAEHGQQYHDINSFRAMLSLLTVEHPDTIEHPVGAFLDEYKFIQRLIEDIHEPWAIWHHTHFIQSIMPTLIKRLLPVIEDKNLENNKTLLTERLGIGLDIDIVFDIEKLAKVTTFPLIVRLIRQYMLQENITVSDTIITQAQTIHKILCSRNKDVPFYVFGHTHQAIMKPLFEDSKSPHYLNAGTWAQYPNSANETCLSFIEIIHDSATDSRKARLLHWQHDQAEAYVV